MFELGLFEDTYRDAKVAAEVAANQADWDKAMDAHRKSVTLLKNDDVLPLRRFMLKPSISCLRERKF